MSVRILANFFRRMAPAHCVRSHSPATHFRFIWRKHTHSWGNSHHFVGHGQVMPNRVAEFVWDPESPRGGAAWWDLDSGPHTRLEGMYSYSVLDSTTTARVFQSADGAGNHATVKQYNSVTCLQLGLHKTISSKTGWWLRHFENVKHFLI